MTSIVSRRLAVPLLLTAAFAVAPRVPGTPRARPGPSPDGNPAAPAPAAPAAAAPINFEVEKIAPPCHPNPHALRDIATVATRGDIRSLPQPLRERLIRLAGRP